MSYHNLHALMDKENVPYNFQSKPIQSKISNNNSFFSCQSINNSCDSSTTSVQMNIEKSCTTTITNHYSEQIVSYLCDASESMFGFLSQHTIKENLRAKMINWMIEVLSTYKMKEQTYFRSVQFMDMFLKKSSICQQPKDIHLLGLTCMHIACKMEEIYPIRLDRMINKIGNKKFTREQVILKQAQIIETLNFNLEIVNIYSIVTSTLQFLFPNSNKQTKYIQKAALYLAKISRFSYHLSQIPQPIISGSVIYISLKILQQCEKEFKPENYLPLICQKLRVKKISIVSVGNQLLDLVKQFHVLFPNLQNLIKFNNIGKYNEQQKMQQQI